MLNWYKKLSLSSKLMFTVGSIAFLIIGTICLSVIFVASATLEDSVKSNLEDVTRLKAKRITSFYSRVENDVNSIVNMIDYRSVFESTTQASLLKVTVSKSVLKSFESILKTKSHFYEAISFVDVSGNPYVRITESKTETYSVIDRGADKEYFRDCLRPLGNFLISNIYKDIDGFNSFVAAEYKVDNHVKGYVLFHLNMKSVYDIFSESSGLGGSGESLIVRSIPGRGALFLNPLKWDTSAALTREITYGSEYVFPLLKALESDTGSAIALDYRLKSVIAAWIPIEKLGWGLVSKIDKEEAFRPINKIVGRIQLVALVTFLIFLGFCRFYFKLMIYPLKRLREALTTLSKGDIMVKPIKQESDDEIGQMVESTNHLMNYQKTIIKFARNIGNGEFEVDGDSRESKGALTQALIQMSDNLKNVAKNEERRSWATEGVAKFGGILRKNNDRIEDLSYDVIFNLVKYFNCVQGGFFLYEFEDEDPIIRLMASYAYDRRKYENKELRPKTGLVGQCISEGKYIYMTEVPESYLNIRSGMGDAPPKSVILIPLKIAEEIHGVIELASFNVFEDYEIDLLEILAENIASIISSVKVNEKTKILLDESNEMAKAMKLQEEELRQNHEEMISAQAEMDRKILFLEDQLKDARKEN